MLSYNLSTSIFVRVLRRPWKVFQAFIANLVFDFPSRKLRVVGITGTTGKTTTIHLATVALESAGYTVGAISSIRIQIGTKVEKNESGLTSLGPWQLQKLLSRMVAAGCHYAVIEVSSHALDQFRFWGVDFDVAAITNLSRDHLDYHRTLEDYAEAKRRLFKAVANRQQKKINGVYVPRVLIASLDDPKTSVFLEEDADFRFGMSLLDSRVPTPPRTEPIVLYAIRVFPDRTTAMVLARGHNCLMYLRLAGAFNVRNALLAIAVGVSQNIPVERISRELFKVQSIPGRFEKLDFGQPFQVIIDYAVTEVALQTLYSAITTMRARRVLAIFGACGNRDRGKRAGMGEVVAKHADITFLTNEDPFSEDPERIFAELEKGLLAGGAVRIAPDKLNNITPGQHVYVKIADRHEAIAVAVKVAQPGDCIVATGKGTEESMRFKDKTIPWNERQIFEDEIKKAMTIK
jgi:UDP-N-acetylmuramyl-tripeptide synthetase